MNICTANKLALAIAVSGALATTNSFAQINRDQEQSNWEQDRYQDLLQKDSQQTTTPEQQTQTTRREETTAADSDAENKEVIAFEFDSAQLNQEGEQKLKEVVEKVKDQQETAKVKVVGFTDTSGPEAYNQHLAEERAKSVENYLKQEGVEEVEVEARGEQDPIASNEDREGRQKNRRVEVIVAATDSALGPDV